MKTQSKSKDKIYFLFIFLTLVYSSSFSQTNYKCYIDNIVDVSGTNKTFEIWVQNTGTTPIRVIGFQAGINFNYDAIANGGTLSISFVPGSGNAILPPLALSAVSISPVSKQILIPGAVVSDHALTPLSPNSPAIRMGKFSVSNTNSFTAVLPQFTWYFSNTTVSTIRTVILCEVPPSTELVNITNPASHAVYFNLAAIPTLPEWGLIIFGVVLLITGSVFLINRQS